MRIFNIKEDEAKKCLKEGDCLGYLIKRSLPISAGFVCAYILLSGHIRIPIVVILLYFIVLYISVILVADMIYLLTPHKW